MIWQVPINAASLHILAAVLCTTDLAFVFVFEIAPELIPALLTEDVFGFCVTRTKAARISRKQATMHITMPMQILWLVIQNKGRPSYWKEQDGKDMYDMVDVSQTKKNVPTAAATLPSSS
jgi:hypothetical protein